MVHIRDTHLNELHDIYDMGSQSHIGEFLSTKSFEVLKKEFNSKNLLYLSIISTTGILAGYIILCKQNQNNTVQLKRILVNEKHQGIGQKSIQVLEQHCINEYKSKRIWLDVYGNNLKAIHIYTKLGYKIFKEAIENNKPVHFYEKML